MQSSLCRRKKRSNEKNRNNLARNSHSSTTACKFVLFLSVTFAKKMFPTTGSSHTKFAARQPTPSQCRVQEPSGGLDVAARPFRTRSRWWERGGRQIGVVARGTARPTWYIQATADQQSLSDLRRQNFGFPLRHLQLRVVQRLLQTNGAEPKELRVFAGGPVPRHRSHPKEMSRLSFRKVFTVRDEAGG